MFNRKVDFPSAIASYDDDGLLEAIEWCIGHMQTGDRLTVWTSLKSNLQNCAVLHELVNRYPDVEHITGRGSGLVRARGPVLMAWPGMDEIGELMRSSSHHVRALCVINWNEDELRPWVSAVKPTVLGDGSPWEETTPALDSLVVAAMEFLTRTVNHNNTISGGYEKDVVVSVLLALRKGGVSMDGAAMQGWALANGWAGGNPKKLAEYVDKINEGRQLRCRRVINADFLDNLRQRAVDGQ
jgi:hypothetical protein